MIRLGPQPSGKIFSYTANGFKSTWRFLCEKLGIVDLHFHDLRHEATSRLFELGTLDMMEIASITGHKSLSMLKRYTYLKATRLVKKLEGNRNRSRQAVLNDLVPYPAAITTHTDGNVEIRLPDFEPDPIRVIAGSPIDIAEYIAVENPRAALKMDGLFSEAAKGLGEFPKLGRTGKIPGTRELFPHENYRLVYEVDEAADTVWVMAVVHTARQWPPTRDDLRGVSKA